MNAPYALQTTSIGYTDMLSAFSGHGGMESHERLSLNNALPLEL